MLRDKEDETKKCFDAQIVNIERELRGAQTKVERLLINASNDTRYEEWSEQIVNSTGLTEGMRCLDVAMERTTLRLKSTKDERMSSDRRTDISRLEEGIRQLFKSVVIPRDMKVVFVPLSSSKKKTEFTIRLCKDSKMKELRTSIVEMARRHYGLSKAGLKEEDVQFADIFFQKVSQRSIHMFMWFLII